MGVLTSLNPTPTSPMDLKNHSPFSVLCEKREGKEAFEIERMMSPRPNSSHKIWAFNG